MVTGTSATETIQFTPTSTDAASITGLGGVTINVATTEQVKINGLGGNDTLNVNSPATSNVVTLTPGAAVDAGELHVDSLVPMTFMNLGSTGRLTITDAGGVDSLVYNGTAASDVFRVPHAVVPTPSIALNNQIGVGQLESKQLR